MKKAIIFLLMTACVAVMSSFSEGNINEFVGNYGVCANDPSQIKLTINADHTFYYQDFSVSENKIIVKGNWTLEGNKVVLIDNNTDMKFHDTWTFEENGQVAKSRISNFFSKNQTPSYTPSPTARCNKPSRRRMR
jgi:hypothetical protein